MTKNNILLYGANGYTATLILNELPAYRLPVIVAGRNETVIKKISEAHQIGYRIIDLNNTPQLLDGLKDIKLVIHCAGPFSFTAKQMVEACIETGTHYIDINGDLSVFEWIKTQDAKAKANNIMLLPGAGFDVIPTDCIAARLKDQMPDATGLKLAFAGFGSSLSHGTAITMIGKLGNGGAKRKDGKIIKTPLGRETFQLPYGNKELFFMSIPWGDVSTAHFTTGIPDITTFTMVKPKFARMLKFQFLFNWLLRMEWVKNRLRKKVKAGAAGPTPEQRQKAYTYVWGEVRNAKGEIKTAGLTCSDGYTLTAHGCLVIASKIWNNNFKPGYQTPVTAYGKELISEIPPPNIHA
jgi:short subunit dehydrogenase-like uncharacterized protein